MKDVTVEVLEAVNRQSMFVSRRFTLAAYRWLTLTEKTAQFAAEIRATTWAEALTNVVLPTLGEEFAMGLDPMQIAQDVWKAAGKTDFDPMLIHERIMEAIDKELKAW